MSTLRGPIFLLNPATYTLMTAYSSTGVTGFDLSNLSDYTHPLRYFKSTADPSTTDIEVVIDLGADAPKVDAIFIDNTNLATWKVQTANGVTSSYSDWVTGLTAEDDPLTGRGKLFIDTTESSSNSRYLKLVATTQTPYKTPTDAGKIGSIVIGTVGNVVDLPSHGVSAIEYTRTVPTKTTEFDGGSIEHIQIGAPYVNIGLPDEPYIRETQEDDVLDIIRKNTSPFVFYENSDYTHKAYVVRHTKLETSAKYQMGVVVNLAMSFREMV